MFKKKTVFVLGAGVGVEYNMPLGKKLKESISSKLQSDQDDLWHSLSKALDLGDQASAREYLNLKKFIASNMDKAESIDNFLHTHSENEKIVAIGKSAIASCIVEAERYSSMMPLDRTSENMLFISLSNNKETWLSRFCTMALTGVVAKDAYRAFEKVTIVTFNYDRCIEQYIVGHIMAYLGITEEAARNIASALTVIHVYGKIGKLPWQMGVEPSVTFGAKPSPDQLQTMSSSIRTFTERLEEDDTQDRIEDAIAEAEMVVFSGFSFGTSNWEFLQNRRPGPAKVAIAGVLGISAQNQRNISTRLAATLHPGGDVHVEAYGAGCLELLYDYSTYFE